MTTRRDICLECEHSDWSRTGDRLTCDLVVDDRRRPVPCLLRRMLAEPSARCPHPDPASAAAWNAAAVETATDCGGDGAVAARVIEADRITLRVRACIGNGSEAPPCPHAGPAWHCDRAGRAVGTDLRNPTFACPAGRFGPEVSRS